MTEPVLHHLDMPGPRAKHTAQRRLAWWEWAPAGADRSHVVVCVHGLTRQARDFDVLAQALSERARVVCVDVAGRGHSDWLADPMDYQIPTYATDLAVVLGHLRQRHASEVGQGDPSALRIDWVGTSMGGLIGMALASQPGLGLRRLVLNDVGPELEPSALQRIGRYVGQAPVFDSEQAAADYLATVSTGFGPHTPAQWLDLTRPMLRPQAHGWGLHYDPDLAQPFQALQGLADPQQAAELARQGNALLWQMYDAITAPTLVLRGAESDLLSRATAHAMAQRGPLARVVEFAGVGHAPTLVAPDQVQAVTAFLFAP